MTEAPSGSQLGAGMMRRIQSTAATGGQVRIGDRWQGAAGVPLRSSLVSQRSSDNFRGEGTLQTQVRSAAELHSTANAPLTHGALACLLPQGLLAAGGGGADDDDVLGSPGGDEPPSKRRKGLSVHFVDGSGDDMGGGGSQQQQQQQGGWG